MHTGPDTARTTEPAAVTWPLPDRRHLLLLAVGVVIGVLLGPAVLGRVSPAGYRAVFAGEGAAVAALRAELGELERQRDELSRLAEVSGVTAVAIEENRAAIDREAMVIEKALAYERLRMGFLQSASLVLGLVVALVVVMIFEAVISPRPGREGRAVLTPMQGRVTTIRYALLSAVLAVLVARPSLLNEVPWVFVVLLLAVIAAAGFVPLGNRREREAVGE